MPLETTPALRSASAQLCARAWPFTARGTAIRLFATCWLVFSLHSATNIVREHYLMLAIGDHLSFRVDEYQALHPDLFERPGYGWHINNNPGISMLAALPYALSRPLIDPIVERIRRARALSSATAPPAYQSPWPNSRAFYAEAWKRGLDVKFGLAALATQLGFMAVVSSLSAVGMFFVLRQIVASERTATWLALLYAFGTPVFFRTGYLNHNVVIGYVAAAGFVALWNPGTLLPWTSGSRAVLAGAAGGAAVLMDYSGVVMLGGLLVYGLLRLLDSPISARRFAVCFGLGAAVPLLMLGWYQWVSFGNPFLPAQRWMPDVQWSDAGYRGISFPMPDLLTATLFDYRFGLFTSAPLMLFAMAAPWTDRGRLLPLRETWFLLGLFAAFWLFCGSVNYGRLQFNTGIRYMTSMLPLLFPLVVVVLVRLPRGVLYAVGVASLSQAWSLAMHRDVERGFGVLDPVLHVFIGGFELPGLTTIWRLGESAGEFTARGVSPLPLFALVTAALYGIWKVRGDAGGPEEPR